MLRRIGMIFVLALGATIGISSIGMAASPAVNPNFVRAFSGDVNVQATWLADYAQTRGVCNYRYRYQRSKSWVHVYYNDGSGYSVKIIQQLQYKNSRGRWVTAKTASKTGYLYGGTGYMSLNKKFTWSNRVLRTRDTRVRTQFRVYLYGGGYEYWNTASNYCG